MNSKSIYIIYVFFLQSFYCMAIDVIDVRYGAGNTWVDFIEAFETIKVNEKLYAGWIDGNKMAGKDPVPGVPKKIIVRYLDKSKEEQSEQFDERCFAGISSETKLSHNFLLGSAWFGENGQYVNVTEKMKAIIKYNSSIIIDLKTLGLSKQQDPLPGKQKQLLLFYSIFSKRHIKTVKEGDIFRGSQISAAYDPLPEAKTAKRTFARKYLDTAVWQWAMPIRGAISAENQLPPKAYLYIPVKTKKVRGVVIGQFNMLEQPILEHSRFRETLQKLNYGCIWVAPSLFGSSFDFRNTKQGEVLENLFIDLANLSGYEELANAPLVGLGHSAMADFPWQLAIWKPDRTICGISYDGSTPGVDYHYNFNDPMMDKNAIERLRGLPMLIRDGEYSGARNNRRPLVLNQMVPNLLITLVADPGSGHFDINDRIIDYIGHYLEVADKKCNFGPGNIKKLSYSSGWNVDYWRVNDAPKAKAAPVRKFKGFVGKRGEEKIWVFDKEFAQYHEQYQRYQRGKKIQLLGYKQDGQLLLDHKDHLQIHPEFKPLADGLTFPLEATFIEQVTDGRAVRWSGLKANQTISHGDDEYNIKIHPICGPVVRIDQQYMAIRFNRFGFTSSRRTGEVCMIAIHPGDETYRRIVLQSSFRIPTRLTKGIAQYIDFPEIENQSFETKLIKLDAKSNTGMPVQYYVEYGPASLLDDVLVFSEVPASAKWPIEISVVAWQYGYDGELKIQSAEPIKRTFSLVK